MVHWSESPWNQSGRKGLWRKVFAEEPIFASVGDYFRARHCVYHWLMHGRGPHRYHNTLLYLGPCHMSDVISAMVDGQGRHRPTVDISNEFTCHGGGITDRT